MSLLRTSSSTDVHGVAAGQIRRHDLQGTTALYRVVSVTAEHAVVEVLEAPGLACGMRFRFLVDAVAKMQLSVAPAAQPVAAQRFGRLAA